MGADITETHALLKLIYPRQISMDFTVSTSAVVRTQNGYVKHIFERPQAVSSRSLWVKSISIELLRHQALKI